MTIAVTRWYRTVKCFDNFPEDTLFELFIRRIGCEFCVIYLAIKKKEDKDDLKNFEKLIRLF